LPQSASVQGAETLNALLTCNVFKIIARQGDKVNKGDVVIIMEAMKMETEICAVSSGSVIDIHIKEGDAVQTGSSMLTLG
jgi:oxaloacetate decarboxylase alpha subunit